MKRDDSSSANAVPFKEISHKLDSLWGIRLYLIAKMPSYFTPQKEEADDVPVPVLSLANPLFSRDELHTTSPSFLEMSSVIFVAVLCIAAAAVTVGYQKKMSNKDRNGLLVESQSQGSDYGSVENSRL